MKSISTSADLQATVTDLSHDGRGVVKSEGKTYFVSGALPGELIKFKPGRKRKGIFPGTLVEILDPATDRVSPQCDYFGICGGCSLQHLDSKAQLIHKQKVLFDNLHRIGKVSPQIRIAPLQGEQWHYRRKARPGCKFVAKKGGILVGFREQGSSFLTSLRSCLTLEQKLSDLLSPLHELVESLDCNTQVPQIELAAGDNAVALVMRHLTELSSSDIDKIIVFAKSSDVHFYLQSGGLDSIVPLWPANPPSLYYELPEYDLKMIFTPADFIQVNSVVNQAMINQAIGYLQPDSHDVVLDLFCGLGNFTLPIARSVRKVMGVEGDQRLVDKALENMSNNDVMNAEFLAIDLYSSAVTAFDPTGYNKLVLDPPRSGALDVVNTLIPKFMPQCIVYVSCNPATLARDAEILVHQHGYLLTHAGAINMFPHTAHVESIAVFKTP